MTAPEIVDSRFTKPLAAEDHVDLVNLASRRSPRMRTMLWAMVGPDGLVPAAFGRRSYVHDAVINVETAAIRAGFKVFTEVDASEPRTRVERRWCSEYRTGLASLAAWVEAGGSGDLGFMRSLGEPTHEERMARLLVLLSEEPSKVELLPTRPLPLRFAEHVDPGDWLVSAVDLLELIDGPAI